MRARVCVIVFAEKKMRMRCGIGRDGCVDLRDILARQFFFLGPRNGGIKDLPLRTDARPPPLPPPTPRGPQQNTRSDYECHWKLETSVGTRARKHITQIIQRAHTKHANSEDACILHEVGVKTSAYGVRARIFRPPDKARTHIV